MTACTLNGATSTFTYGADGLRRSMTVGGVTTYYVYDGQTLIREMQGEPGSLHATATYLSGPRGPEYRRDDTRQETDGQGKTYLGTARWYVYDGLGSVVGEVDPAGNVTCSDKYDVYGAVRGRAGTASTAHGFVGSLGHLSDAATGLVYMKARYYDPGTGRFASEDPGRSGGNWFAYASNNPVNDVDANGKDAQAVLKALGTLDVALWTSQIFRGVFIAACCFLLIPELALLGTAASGSIDTGCDFVSLLCYGIMNGLNTAVAGVKEITGVGGAIQETIGLIMGYSAVFELTSDVMDAVDDR